MSAPVISWGFNSFPHRKLSVGVIIAEAIPESSNIQVSPRTFN
jgi:hypothetical protein